MPYAAGGLTIGALAGIELAPSRINNVQTKDTHTKPHTQTHTIKKKKKRHTHKNTQKKDTHTKTHTKKTHTTKKHKKAIAKVVNTFQIYKCLEWSKGHQ